MTIQDIAKEAGVGKATVSRVINGNGYVSADAENRIRKVIEENHYQPSAAARSLSCRHSDTVGLILPEIENPFFSGVLRGVTQVVEECGYTLVLSSSENDPEQDLRAVTVMNRQRVRGLIYVPACDYSDDAMFDALSRELAQLSCPIVMLDRKVDRLEYDAVSTDNTGGACECTQALIDAGHRRIGIIAGDMQLSLGRERYRGFCKALEDNRLELKDSDVVYGDFNQEIAYQKVKEMFEKPDYPHAFFLCNNLSESGFLRAVFEFGLRIPEDIAFTSFDKITNQDIFNKPFSYLERNVQKMGEEGARLLFRRIEDPGRPIERIIIKSEMVLLGSERKL